MKTAAITILGLVVALALPCGAEDRKKITQAEATGSVVTKVPLEYPAIAKQARVGGVVQLMGLIGIDGHLKELRLVNGHPLLAQAAIRAVSQWVYSPTELNGELVEVEAPITVTFRLQ